MTPAAPSGFTDHTFKSASGAELAVRVWPAETPQSQPAPFVIWTHGGGWFGGFHFAPLPWMVPGFRQRGYHFVSHNYRLAPQARVDDQLADCLEAVTWCRANLPSIIGTDQVNVDQYVLCGESAGGHLATLMALHLANPPPKAVVDVYGVVDFLSMKAFGPLEQRPNRATQGPWKGKFSEETLNKLLRDRDRSNVLTDALPWNEFERLTDTEISNLWATDFRYTERVLQQAELHMMHSLSRSADGLHVGIMHNEKFESEEELMAFVRSMSPLRVLQQGVEEGRTGPDLYPPTAFLHGTCDVDVPVEQSYAMAGVLKSAGVPVIECYEEGEAHVFDLKYTGPSVPGWDTYIEPIISFVDKHVRA
ncbi:putative isoprenylcysteine alpha-carbonyl methylesterase ICMEL2 [Corynascus novoguineensis]|uniref:Isoprenylcysteine alpha-carbonyl methylesterase ICMEL2 n=1 Tax=Corynascus novoguineensis TaxID=1126955 RepID=A0AAN7CKG3_9PEZI|nr:putative isoprenylcysteine alpha-carbonyl methylesterase ICMEL2 [Corynascus novoguineensis]